jgi:hypothetical protein
VCLSASIEHILNLSLQVLFLFLRKVCWLGLVWNVKVSWLSLAFLCPATNILRQVDPAKVLEPLARGERVFEFEFWRQRLKAVQIVAGKNSANH